MDEQVLYQLRVTITNRKWYGRKVHTIFDCSLVTSSEAEALKSGQVFLMHLIGKGYLTFKQHRKVVFSVNKLKYSKFVLPSKLDFNANSL